MVNRTFDISNSEISLRENCGLLAHSALAGGILSGKYLNGNKPIKSRFYSRQKSLLIHNSKKGEIASKNTKNFKKYNISIVSLAYSFVLSRPFVTIVYLVYLQKIKCIKI